MLGNACSYQFYMQQESIPVGRVMPTRASYVLQKPSDVTTGRGGVTRVSQFEQVSSPDHHMSLAWGLSTSEQI